MKYILILVATALVIFFVMSPRAQQLAKSVWLIAQTYPYKQIGTGAGLIVVVGDSTAYGTGVTNPAESIAGRIGTDFPEYEVRTLAKNGRVLDEIPAALKAGELQTEADIMVLQIGGNDILQGRTLDQIETDTRAALIEAKKYAKHVVFMSCGNVGTAAVYVKNEQPDEARTEQTLLARAVFMRVATELGVTYVDLYVPPGQDMFLKEPEIYFAIDGLHPSAAGYGVWYESLSPVVRALLTN